MYLTWEILIHNIGNFYDILQFQRTLIQNEHFFDIEFKKKEHLLRMLKAQNEAELTGTERLKN